MGGRLRAYSIGIAAVLVLMILPAAGLADPCLMVYPDGTCIYHYDPAEYYTVGPGDPLYDAMYDRGGEVLIDINTGEIAYDIYQAPGLVGFQEDPYNQGLYTMEMDFTLIVDGYSNTPTTYTNVLLVFDTFQPDGCTPVITIDGSPPLYDAGLGYYYPIGDLAVSTPLPYGGSYSDTMTFDFMWSGCSGLRIWAFADADYNLQRDGGECFSAYSHDLTVPTKETSWGKIKSIYR